MKKKQMIILAAMFFVVFISGMSFGEEKVGAKKEKGEVNYINIKNVPNKIKRTHEAKFVVKGDSYVTITSLISTEAYKGMSDLQKKYLDEQLYVLKQRNIKDKRSSIRSVQNAVKNYDTRNGMKGYVLCGVSEEDVKKMVEAALEFSRERLIGRIQEYKKHVADLSEKMEQVRSKIGELEKELKPVVEKRVAFEKGLNPALLKGDEAIIKIHDQLDEYKIMLRGNEARQEAIDRTMHIFREKLKLSKSAASSAERQAINALMIKYDEMQADLEIERSGIKAEKEMLEERLAKVQAYWDTTERHGELDDELRKLKGHLSENLRTNNNLVEFLKKLKSQPIEIVDNEVIVSGA